MKDITVTMASILGAFLFVGFLAVLMAWPTQWLWNTCLVPAVDSVNHIGFWQALGINILASTLFKNSTTKKEK